MKIIVVGCGRVGAQLADRLFHQGHQVTVVDVVASAFDSLDPSFRGRTLEGDVLAQDMLRRAGIETADGLAAVTSSDTLNCVICHVARTVYHVANVVARNYEPRWIPLYEAFGIQAVGASTWGAQRIEEILADATLRTVFSAGNGEVEIYEILVPEAWQGRRLNEMVNAQRLHAGRPDPRGQGHAAGIRYDPGSRRRPGPERDLRRHRSAAPATWPSLRRPEMFVLIAGGGRTGTQLASTLLAAESPGPLDRTPP